MRIISTFACLILLLLPVAAAPDGTGAYLAARDRYIAQFKVRPPTTDGADKREGRALDDLEHRIKAIIPPWHPSGSAAEGKINLSILHQDLGFGTLDGLAYGARVTQVIVTTAALLQHWIAGRKSLKILSLGVPQTVDAAIRSSQFWTFSFGDDNGWVFFGDVPVEIPGGKGAAQLAVDTDSGFPDEGPKYLLVTIVRGDRVFVARQKLAIKVSRQPVCEALLHAEHKTDDQAEQDFRACFASHLHEQPQYDAIQEQAQALIDLLH